MTLKSDDYFCLEISPLQQQLRLSSIIYMTMGGAISVLVLLLNMSIIFFFIFNQKTKRSPLCIYLFFLSITILIRLAEFYLSTLVKLKIINTEENKKILLNSTRSEISNDPVCKWFHFMERFSNHISVYLVLLIQFQRYLTIKIKISSLHLLLYNHALSYFICFAIILAVFIIDEFYLYDNYFITVVYCPLTMIFSCVVNENFNLLQTVKFNTNKYHQVHTVIYHVIPFIICLVLSYLIHFELKNNKKFKRNRENSSSSRNSTIKDSFKRKRHASNSSNLSRLIRRGRKTVIFSKLNIIFFQQSDITYICILATLFQIINTFPPSILSYLTEWNTDTVENIAKMVTRNSSSLSNSLNEQYTKQIKIYFFYVLLGTIYMFNFNFYLLYTIFSSKCLLKEFKKTLNF
ncbi:unnamed protein product [Brachionus calyciflorus]|uniref:G-protein coupled receptors family 1 profile domain-containing protein n=1 Tax=Brachionus calyciflorus TaxID=104777 RepID=A0A814DTV5_9BILA|nr:unnamed protein product [Brachionus calyciflorus]